MIGLTGGPLEGLKASEIDKRRVRQREAQAQPRVRSRVRDALAKKGGATILGGVH